MDPMYPLEGVDKLLGVFCLFCLLVGTPANILSFLYFRKQAPTASSVLYSVISLTDTWICFNGYPTAVLLLSNRSPALFEDFTFRQLWGLTWEPFPYFSVSLVLMISLTRTIKIVAPMVQIKRKHVLIPVIGYAVFLAVRFLVGFIFFGKYEMIPYGTYPFIHITDQTYTNFDLYLAMILLAFPIIPIIVSAAISTTVLMLSKNSSVSTPSTDKVKNQASVTVLIFTAVYIGCNVPVFLCYLRFAIFKLSGWKTDIFNGPSVFLNRYIWLLTYIASVQLNSLLNPCVYFSRMTDFRKELGGFWGRAVGPASEVSASAPGTVITNYSTAKEVSSVA